MTRQIPVASSNHKVNTNQICHRHIANVYYLGPFIEYIFAYYAPRVSTIQVVIYTNFEKDDFSLMMRKTENMRNEPIMQERIGGFEDTSKDRTSTFCGPLKQPWAAGRIPTWSSVPTHARSALGLEVTSVQTHWNLLPSDLLLHTSTVPLGFSPTLRTKITNSERLVDKSPNFASRIPKGDKLEPSKIRTCVNAVRIDFHPPWTKSYATRPEASTRSTGRSLGVRISDS